MQEKANLCPFLCDNLYQAFAANQHKWLFFLRLEGGTQNVAE